MSCSSCYHCFEGVARYDKYCKACQKRFGLPDLPDYQKGRAFPSDKERLLQFNEDSGSLRGKCTCDIGLLPCQIHGWKVESGKESQS